MKRKTVLAVFCLVLAMAIYGYAQDLRIPNAVAANNFTPQIKSLDINKDSKPDITYSGDDKFVNKVEADTNYDGMHDIIIHAKDGKFVSAEVDSDYNGKPDKKFTDQEAFKKWLNENRPEFKDALDKADWRFDLLKF